MVGNRESLSFQAFFDPVIRFLKRGDEGGDSLRGAQLRFYFTEKHKVCVTWAG